MNENFNNPYNSLYGYQQQPNMMYYQPPVPSAPSTAKTGGGMGQMGGIGGAISGPLQLGFGIGQAIRGNRDRKKFAKMTEAELNAMPEYTSSPYAAAELAQAQSQQNAINPAISGLQNQQQQLAANVASAGQNYAQNGGEAIMAAISGANMANQNLPQIAAMQAEYQQAQRAALASAQRGMTGERMNAFNSRLQKNQARYNHYLGRTQGANKEFGDGWQNIVGGANATGNAAGDILKMSGGM